MPAKDPLQTGQIILNTVGDVPLIKTDTGITIVDASGNIDAPVTTTNLTISGSTTLSGILVVDSTTATSGAGAVAITGTIHGVFFLQNLNLI